MSSNITISAFTTISQNFQSQGNYWDSCDLAVGMQYIMGASALSRNEGTLSMLCINKEAST